MALFVTLFLTAGPGDSAGQTTSEPKPTAAPPSSAAIPAEEVATRASEATNLLTALSAKFAPSPEIEKIQESLPVALGVLGMDLTKMSVLAGAFGVGIG